MNVKRPFWSRLRPAQAAALIAAAYTLAALTWVLLSDLLMRELAPDPRIIILLQTIRTCALIALTAGILAGLAYRRLRTMIGSQRQSGGADGPASRDHADAARGLDREREGLKTTARAVGEILGTVSHELRTPLASVRAVSECLLTEEVHDPAMRERMLQSINEEVVRMTEMIVNMLEAARLDSGEATWRWSRLNVGDACRDAVAVLRPLVDTRRIDLAIDVDPPDLTMNGDAEAIRRLVLNLVGNAHKHTPAGTIRVEARALSDEAGQWVVLRVADTGQGIPRRTMRRLGQAFVLNQGSIGHGHRHGAGLGLAICGRIVAAHGGRIAVESAPGLGAVFTVRLRADLPQFVLGAPVAPIIQEAAGATHGLRRAI